MPPSPTVQAADAFRRAFAERDFSPAAEVLADDVAFRSPVLGDPWRTRAVLERLAGAVELLVVGQADTFGTDVPPLIERKARDRVRRYADVARREGELVAVGREPPADGWFASPMVVTGLPAGSAVLTDEIFGPLLAIERVASVAAACSALDESRFALTAGLFSRDPAAIREFVARAPAGNLYVNRPITGAMVGRQPFGGNRRSGVASKAGGPDYLLQFVDPRVISESTMRHGLPTA